MSADKEHTLFGFKHRWIGPAVEYANGTKFWFWFGKQHRWFGPSVECRNGNRHWHWLGIHLGSDIPELSKLKAELAAHALDRTIRRMVECRNADLIIEKQQNSTLISNYPTLKNQNNELSTKLDIVLHRESTRIAKDIAEQAAIQKQTGMTFSYNGNKVLMICPEEYDFSVISYYQKLFGDANNETT